MERNNCFTLVAAALFFIVGLPPVLQAKTIYVDANATGLNDGSSWPNAYRFLQDALADAQLAAKPVEIRVATGVYQPDRSSAHPNGTRDLAAKFCLLDGVVIKGGVRRVRGVRPQCPGHCPI